LRRPDARLRSVLTLGLAAALLSGCGTFRNTIPETCPEQTRIEFRPPEAFPRTPLPRTNAPRTFTNPDNGRQELRLSLDEAIRIALDNSEVIRVLAGVTAVSSGQTMYDPAIANTAIDLERSRFDPTVTIGNTFSSDDTAVGVFTPGPPGARIGGTNVDAYDFSADVSKTNALGGTASLRTGVTRTELEPGLSPLDPQARYFTEVSYVQPLLRGAGQEANLAPVVIARLNTEQSFFQFKDAMQELVRGVVEAYWSLVFARTDRWAREQQIEQAKFAYERELARIERGFGELADVAQTRLAQANFQATYVTAQSNVLTREAALLNILGLSPAEVGEVIPTTPPHFDRVEFGWNELVSLAEQYRPDIIELKLIIEADQQRLVQARNSARPTLDAVALYRWDGLQGETPSGREIGTGGDDYTDWTLGVNFSVPLGLRQGRAATRQQELLIVRDQANLRQGLHAATHRLALDVRNIDQAYEQYKAFLVTREAARDNLSQQWAEFVNGTAIFLNVLQGIANWGDAVSAEAQSLTQYNTELANLERQTGTILEAHGVRFLEERFRFAGPLCGRERCYAAGLSPTDNAPKYRTGEKPAEEAFDLTQPVEAPDSVRPPPPTAPPLPEPREGVRPAAATLPPHAARSLVAQGLNRIEAARSPRGVEAKEHSHGGREHDRHDGGRE
jgi:outer membrane protein TolC